MPHLTLEYSNNLPVPVDFKALFKNLHEALIVIGPFRLEDIKSRAIPYPEYYIGVGLPENVFIHLTVSILSGRDVDFKKRIGERMLSILRETFLKTCLKRRCDITVDIREMQRETYYKAVNE